jgi:hypothetical protein
VCRDARTDTETVTVTTESDGTATPDPPTDTALLSIFCAAAGIAIVPAENAVVLAENAATSLPRYMGGGGGAMTVAEIAHAAIEPIKYN